MFPEIEIRLTARGVAIRPSSGGEAEFQAATPDPLIGDFAPEGDGDDVATTPFDDPDAAGTIESPGPPASARSPEPARPVPLDQIEALGQTQEAAPGGHGPASPDDDPA